MLNHPEIELATIPFVSLLTDISILRVEVGGCNTDNGSITHVNQWPLRVNAQ